MRNILALAFLSLLLSSQTYACRDPSAQLLLFFKDIPNPPPVADVVAKISLLDVGGGTATAVFTNVISTTDARFHQGGKIPLIYGNSSCGPSPLNGSEGMIFAKKGIDSKGRLVLYPYVQNHHGHVSQPTLSEEFR
jgi:hypothetical protein